MSRQAERRRADALKALNAREQIQKRLPFVLSAMTPDQVDQLQRFFDAQVVNPQVYKEWQELDRKSNPRPVGQQTYRDPGFAERMMKKEEEYIRLGDNDKRIRLDHSKLLAPDSFQPETDNPDEASYHLRVRNTLANSGVWLRFDRRFLAAIDRPETVPENDPKRFSFALTLGPEGQPIPTTNGQLTREGLRRSNAFAVDYLENVHFGPTRKLLDQAIKSLQVAAINGWQDHFGYTGHSVVARPVTEWKAGVNLPDIRMWEVARRNLSLASDHLAKGQYAVAHEHIKVAAIMIMVAEQALSHYMTAMSVAAEKIVAVLEKAVWAGEVAGKLLLVRSVGMRILRSVTVNGSPVVAAEAGAGAGGGAAAARSTTKVPSVPKPGGGSSGLGPTPVPNTPFRAPTPQPGQMAKSPVVTQQGKYQTNFPGKEAYESTLRERQAYEIAVQRGNHTVGSTIEASSSGGARSGGNFVSNRQALAEEQRLAAYQKEFFKEMAEYTKKHPRVADYSPQMELIHRRLAAKWGIKNLY